MLLAWVAPMVGVLGLFWSVARKLGHIESEVKELRKENQRLEAELLSVRTLLALVVDSRRQTA